MVEKASRKGRKKRVVAAIAIVLAIALVAIGVGVYAYFKTTDKKLRLESSNAQSSLVAPDSNEPFFVLCEADMDDPKTRAIEEQSIGYMLVRVDFSSKMLTFATIPMDLQVRMSDGIYRPLYEAKGIGGDAELISSLSEMLGEDIAHFVYTNESGIESMVDLIGGLSFEVTEEIDDPYAGIQVIEAGDTVLNGTQAVTFLKATNVQGGLASTARNRVDFTMALVGHALSSQGLDYANIVSNSSDYIDTDISASDLLSFGNSLRPLESYTVHSCVVPSYTQLDNESEQIKRYLSKSRWAAMAEHMGKGDDPNSEEAISANVTRQDVTVEIRNGTQTPGAAAQLGEILTGFGYQVIGVGNTNDDTIYPETLIVYTNTDFEAAANAVQEDMQSGRVVNGGSYYFSDANVIVVIGRNWIPIT